MIYKHRKKYFDLYLKSYIRLNDCNTHMIYDNRVFYNITQSLQYKNKDIEIIFITVDIILYNNNLYM